MAFFFISVPGASASTFCRYVFELTRCCEHILFSIWYIVYMKICARPKQQSNPTSTPPAGRTTLIPIYRICMYVCIFAPFKYVTRGCNFRECYRFSIRVLNIRHTNTSCGASARNLSIYKVDIHTHKHKHCLPILYIVLMR